MLVEHIDDESVALSNLTKPVDGRIVIGGQSLYANQSIFIHDQMFAVSQRRHIGKKFQLRYLLQSLNPLGGQRIRICLHIIGYIVEYFLIRVQTPVASFRVRRNTGLRLVVPRIPVLA